MAAAAVILCAVLIPLMTEPTQRIFIWSGVDFGGYQWFLNNYHGLIQRLGAVVVFVPVGVVAHIVRRRSSTIARAYSAR